MYTYTNANIGKSPGEEPKVHKPSILFPVVCCIAFDAKPTDVEPTPGGLRLVLETIRIVPYRNGLMRGNAASRCRVMEQNGDFEQMKRTLSDAGERPLTRTS